MGFEIFCLFLFKIFGFAEFKNLHFLDKQIGVTNIYMQN